MANGMNRFLGGSVLGTIAKLILLSLLLGVVLAALGFDPDNIVESIRRLIFGIWDMGFEAVRALWQYFLLGAILVVPIWLIARLMRGGAR